MFLNQWNAVYKIQIMQQCQLTISPIIFKYKNLCILSSNCIVLVKRDVRHKLLIFTREQMPSFHVANNFSYFFLEDKMCGWWLYATSRAPTNDVIFITIKTLTPQLIIMDPSPIEHTFLENSSGRTFQFAKLVGKIFNSTTTPLLVKWLWKLIFHIDFFLFNIVIQNKLNNQLQTPLIFI